ncbi:MAG: ATP-binding protein [Deltaproteobacteria bacterium]|nr:ATP-binding protein [Deltaproteobacteria bacterium]
MVESIAESLESMAAVTWAEANQAYLRTELRRLRLLFLRKVRWLRQTWQQDPLPHHRSVVISDAHADRLLRGMDDEESQFHQEDAESCAIARAVEEVEAELTIRCQILIEAGGIPALEALARAFGLSPFERDAVLLCFAVDEAPEFATLCAYIQDDVNARWATLQLVLSVLCQTREQRESARAPLLPSSPLRRFRLLTLSEGSAAQGWRPLRIDERVADYVRGINRLDESMIHLVRPAPPVPIAGAHRELVDQLVRWAESAAGQPWPPFQLTGPAGAGKKAIAGEFCARAGLQLYTFDLRHLSLQDVERHQLLHVMEREAVLSRMALYVDVADFDFSDRLLTAAARDWVERYGGVLFVGGRECWQFQRQVLHIAVPKPNSAEQRQLWTSSLQGITTAVDGQIEAIVQQFDLGPHAIPQAVSAAVARVRTRPGDFRLGAEDLWQACREQVGWQLGSLAQRLTPCYTWDDIVLPDDLMQQLRELADQVATRAQVYERWGFGARLPRGRGIGALFSGPSGTGKTMAAEILANELKLDLYRIDLAGVVSKYIGETEKNLRNVFDAAEQSGAILFFDEADALFGKRSEVKDSHDRYANIEVNYLLQRMEDYRGLAILCTNRRAALDRAFLRRLRFLVEFPFPDGENRRRIWQKVFPPQAPLAPLDLTALSRLEISGGNIRNIALNAAFLAAGESTSIRMEHVLHAAYREYVKIDKLLTEAEFGAHLRLIKP